MTGTDNLDTLDTPGNFETYQLANCWKGKRQRTRNCQIIDPVTLSPLTDVELQSDGTNRPTPLCPSEVVDPDIPQSALGDLQELTSTEAEVSALGTCGMIFFDMITHFDLILTF